MLLRSLLPCLVLATACLPLAVAQEKVIEHATAEDPAQVAQWGDIVTREEGAGRNGGAAFGTTGNRKKIISPNWIEVDPAKTYLLEGYLRSEKDEPQASGYFGLLMYTKEKQLIALKNVVTFPDTGTELLEEAKEGETTLAVAENPTWKEEKPSIIAFGAEADFSDLPNFDLSAQRESLAPRPEGGVLITLKEPLKKSYPKGTKVRLHSPWGAPLYWVADAWIPTEWTRYSTTLHGFSVNNAPIDKFWPGTHYVRIFAELGNWNRIPKEGAKLLFDDLIFKEIAPVAQPQENAK